VFEHGPVDDSIEAFVGQVGEIVSVSLPQIGGQPHLSQAGPGRCQIIDGEVETDHLRTLLGERSRRCARARTQLEDVRSGKRLFVVEPWNHRSAEPADPLLPEVSGIERHVTLTSREMLGSHRRLQPGHGPSTLALQRFHGAA